MDELLARVLDAHLGLDRWSGLQMLTAPVSIGGPVGGWRGRPGILSPGLDARRSPRRPRRWPAWRRPS